MLGFSRISLVVVFCGVAFLMAPPAAQANPPEIRLIDVNGTTVTTLSFHGQNGSVTIQNVAIGGFIVSLEGHAHLRPSGVLQLTATITGGGPTERLTILLTNTNYPQTGLSTFAENVTGTITGPGSVTFGAFLDQNDQPFAIAQSTNHLSLLGPYPPAPPDAPISGSDATTVTDTTTYSMTSQTTIIGGDVNFTFTVTNTPSN